MFAGGGDEDEERSLHAVLGHIGGIDVAAPAGIVPTHAGEAG